MKLNQKRLPRTNPSGGYFLNTQKQPQNTNNENRPKLHLKRRFKSSRYRHRIPDEKLHLKPSSKHILMPFTQKMSFWAPMSTPKTVHNGSGSQRFRFKRFRLTDNRFGSRPSRYGRKAASFFVSDEEAYGYRGSHSAVPLAEL